MRKVKMGHICAILVLALFLQMGFLNHVKLFGAKPDLMLILTVFFGLFFGKRKGLQVGFVAGLIADLFTADFFGINMFILGVTGFSAGAISAKLFFFKESKTAELVLVFSFTVFAAILHFALVLILTGFFALNFRDYFISSVLPVSIYTSLLSIPVFLKLINVYGLKELKELI